MHMTVKQEQRVAKHQDDQLALQIKGARIEHARRNVEVLSKIALCLQDNGRTPTWAKELDDVLIKNIKIMNEEITQQNT